MRGDAWVPNPSRRPPLRAAGGPGGVLTHDLGDLGAVLVLDPGDLRVRHRVHVHPPRHLLDALRRGAWGMKETLPRKPTEPLSVSGRGNRGGVALGPGEEGPGTGRAGCSGTGAGVGQRTVRGVAFPEAGGGAGAHALHALHPGGVEVHLVPGGREGLGRQRRARPPTRATRELWTKRRAASVIGERGSGGPGSRSWALRRAASPSAALVRNAAPSHSYVRLPGGGAVAEGPQAGREDG